MAVKKASTPKTSSAPKAAATKKAATTKKATVTKKAPAPKKATATKKAPAKKATKASTTKTKKPSVVKKAAAVKLSESQARVLTSVQQAPEAGYAAGKGEAKILESLLKKKLIKRGKKVDGSARFMATKAGAKHVATPSVTSAPPTSSVESSVAPSPVAHA
jgi:hypothetical protein